MNTPCNSGVMPKLYYETDFFTQSVLKQGSVDLVITSPPLKLLRGQTEMQKILEALIPLMKKDGRILIDMPIGIDWQTDLINAGRDLGWCISQHWYTENMYEPDHAQILYLVVKKNTIPDRISIEMQRALYLQCSKTDHRRHVCEFDRDLIHRLIEGCCPPKRARCVVLDPFCGTGIVAEEACILGHRGIGIDVRKKELSNTCDRSTS